MNKEFFEALNFLANENGISPEMLAEKIEQGVFKAVKRDFPDTEDENIIVKIDLVKNKFEMKIMKNVVEEIEDEGNEITLDDALKISKRAKVGKQVAIKLDPAKFGRVAAGAAKQSIKHDIREFEKEKILTQYQGKEHECVIATVQKVETETGNAIITVDGNELLLMNNEQIPGEELNSGDTIKVYIVGIINPDKNPIIKVSRTHKDLVKRLFEIEVPEIYDGTVEVMSISREPGMRSKVAVWSKDENVDAVGACIGARRSRISAIVNELNGEKIDIIPYSEDDAEFIKAALSPAKVLKVEIAEDGTRACKAIVPDTQLSLAIGNKGQNAKLAAKLTGYKIDIGPENPIEID